MNDDNRLLGYDGKIYDAKDVQDMQNLIDDLRDAVTDRSISDAREAFQRYDNGGSGWWNVDRHGVRFYWVKSRLMDNRPDVFFPGVL